MSRSADETGGGSLGQGLLIADDMTSGEVRDGTAPPLARRYTPTRDGAATASATNMDDKIFQIPVS